MTRLLLVAALLASLPAPRARACATCTVGDPTLTTLGTGQPSRGRLRAGLVLRHHRETLRNEAGRTTLRQERYELGLAWAPSARWMLGLTLPAAYQRFAHPNLAETRRWSFGDVALTSRAVLYRDRALGARHLLVGVLGLELPTASRPRGIPDELHAGSASWDPIAGLDYLWFGSPWSLLLGARVLVPMAARGDDERPAPAFQAVTSVQWQPHPVVGGRLNAQLRRETGHGGSSLLRVGAGVVVAPATDLVLHAQVSLPAWQTGITREGLTLEIGGTVDF